jgi:hypothetical protein
MIRRKLETVPPLECEPFSIFNTASQFEHCLGVHPAHEGNGINEKAARQQGGLLFSRENSSNGA